MLRAIRFQQDDVRPMGRPAAGVRGIRLQPADRVVAMGLAQPGGDLLVVTEEGYGKRTPLADYPVPRMTDVPPIEVILLDQPDLASAGAGETPIIAVAPAIANAIFDATGARIRQVPFTPARVKAALDSRT